METAQLQTEQPLATPPAATLTELKGDGSITLKPDPVAVPKPGREDFYAKEGLVEKTEIKAQEPAVEPQKPQEPPQAKPEEPAPAPKLYAKKFKSPEELERAYTELQSLTTKKTTEIAQALRDVKDATKEGKSIAEAIQTTDSEDGPDPLLDPRGYKEHVIQAALRRQAEQQQADSIIHTWRESNNDILDLEPLVSFKLLSDPRIKEAKNLDEVGMLIEEHTAYARGLATRYREAGRQEMQQKFNSIPPSAPQNSLDGPPAAESTTAKDEVSDTIAARNRMRFGRPVRARG